MPGPPSGNLLDVFEAREVPYLARLRQNPRLLRLREQIHMPMVVGRGFFIITSMGSRQISPLDLYRRRAFAEDTAEKTQWASADETNLLSALRRPRPAATGKSWHLDKVHERIYKVGARFTFSGRCVVMAIAGTARAIWRALWAEVEKIPHHPAQTGV